SVPLSSEPSAASDRILPRFVWREEVAREPPHIDELSCVEGMNSGPDGIIQLVLGQRIASLDDRRAVSVVDVPERLFSRRSYQRLDEAERHERCMVQPLRQADQSIAPTRLDEIDQRHEALRSFQTDFAGPRGRVM